MKKNPRIAIVVSRFNTPVTKNLLKCATDTLRKKGIKATQLNTIWVPGAYELPFAAHTLALTKKYDAVICLGCIIKGETSHDQHIASWASIGTGVVSLLTTTPVLFGVLTPKNERQALNRSKPGPLNRGKEVAEAALEMIQFNKNQG